MNSKLGIHVSIVPATGADDIARENFTELNRRGFVRTVSPREQWILLVNDAWRATKLPENELVRDYLSLMLERYMTQVDLYQRLASYSYVYQVLRNEHIDPVCLQDVADTGLLYVALIPERSMNRHEPRSLKYSTELSESIYRRLASSSEGKDDCVSNAYREMSVTFGRAMMVLKSLKLPSRNARVDEIALKIPKDTDVPQIAGWIRMVTEVSVGSAQ